MAFLYDIMGARTVPKKSKRPCSHPNCPKLTEGRYCVEHQRQAYQRYDKYERDPASRKRYGYTWRRIRSRYVAEHPFCELCFERGVLVLVEEVHHKVPLSVGGTHDWNNLISLCRSCHSCMHNLDDSRWHQKKRRGG